MILDDMMLDKWLECRTKSTEKIYYSKYNVIKDDLINTYYSDIGTGAQNFNPDMNLNDHGWGHVEKVIKHASLLVATNNCDLNVIEVYLLLVSILFHDLGNIYGRKDHEKKVHKILSSYSKHIGDALDTTIVRKIVDAHGGTDIEGNKDKITYLEEEKIVFTGHRVRKRLLASILRFADELADDRYRASKGLLEHGLIQKGSRIHHIYSDSICPPIIDHNNKQIKLQYYINEEYLNETFGDDQVYLIDEIYNRILKMHFERLYCMRFATPFIQLDKIVGNIEFINSEIGKNLDKITFEIMEKGYPDGENCDIYSLCPELTDRNGENFDGKYIKNKLDQLLSERDD
jgi:HD superfamily phosphodiesterase